LALVLQFFLAMSEHPEAMTKAQKEIDAVVGLDRLPAFDDRKNLPYVEALFNECIRYGVAVPLCMFSSRLVMSESLPFLCSSAPQVDGG
jgi:cytochrome P450